MLQPSAVTSEAARLTKVAGPKVVVLILVGIALLAGLIVWYRLRVSRFREQALDARSGLKRWARARGWQADDVSNLGLHDRAERIMAVAGDLGVELRVGAGARFDTNATELGTIVGGTGTHGQVTAFETWKGNGQSGRWIVAAVEVGRDLPRRTVDLADGKPRISDGGNAHALIQAVAGLPSPSRARQGGQMVVVITPGRLDERALEWLIPRVERLAKESE